MPKPTERQKREILAAVFKPLKSEPPVRSSELVLRLQEQLWTMVRRASYVCAHNYSPDAPVGTREIAIEDLRAETRRTIDLLLELENKKLTDAGPDAPGLA